MVFLNDIFNLIMCRDVDEHFIGQFPQPRKLQTSSGLLYLLAKELLIVLEIWKAEIGSAYITKSCVRTTLKLTKATKVLCSLIGVGVSKVTRLLTDISYCAGFPQAGDLLNCYHASERGLGLTLIF